MPRRTSSGSCGQGPVGRVEVPVGIVGREHDPARHRELVEQLEVLLGALRLLHRLGAHPEALAHQLRRQPVEVGHLGAELPPGPVEPPHQRWQPREAALDQHEAQAREAREHALAEQAPDLRLERAGHRGGILDVERREACRRDGMAAPAAVVHADRQSVPLAGLVDRPVAAPPDRLDRAREHQHLHEAAVAREPIDLGRRGGPVLVGDDDGGTQAGIPVEPLGGQPVVRRTCQHAGQLEVQHLADAEQRVEDRRLHIPRVEQLLLREGEVGRGRSATWRPCVDTRGARGGTRVLRADVGAIAEVLAHLAELGRQVGETLATIAPDGRQVRTQGVVVGQRVVDVAVDQRFAPALRTALGLRHVAPPSR